VHVRVKKAEGVLELRLTGDINMADIGGLESALNDLKDVKAVHLDLAEVDFATSMFLSALFTLKKKHPALALKLFNPNHLLSEMIRMTKLSQIAEVCYQNL
jgi:anti-anti-sigma factor